MTRLELVKALGKIRRRYIGRQFNTNTIESLKVEIQALMMAVKASHERWVVEVKSIENGRISFRMKKLSKWEQYDSSNLY